MRAAAGWMLTPANRMVPFGDSGAGLAPGYAQEEAEDAIGLNLMHQSGLAAIREGDSYLLVTAGFHNRTHKHADELGFHLYEHGRDVISDSGVYHYNFDKWRDFSTLGGSAQRAVGRQPRLSDRQRQEDLRQRHPCRGSRRRLVRDRGSQPAPASARGSAPAAVPLPARPRACGPGPRGRQARAPLRAAVPGRP